MLIFTIAVRTHDYSSKKFSLLIYRLWISLFIINIIMISFIITNFLIVSARENLTSQTRFFWERREPAKTHPQQHHPFLLIW